MDPYVGNLELLIGNGKPRKYLKPDNLDLEKGACA